MVTIDTIIGDYSGKPLYFKGEAPHKPEIVGLFIIALTKFFG